MESMMMRLNGGLSLEKMKWLKKLKSKKNDRSILTDIKRFNSFQDRFSSQWLKIIWFAEKMVPNMVGSAFLSSEVEGESLGIQS